MNVKVKLVSNFVVDIESSSFDAQEAQKGPGYKARSNPSYSLVPKPCSMLHAEKWKSLVYVCMQGRTAVEW